MSEGNNVALADAGLVSAAPAGLIYVGFWRRLAAYAIDFAILLPYGLLAKQLIYTSRYSYLANVIFGTVIALVFEVYLVKRFGGSPGKIILGIRIAKLDGSAVGYPQAIIRYSVLFIITALTSTGLLLSLFGLSDQEYAAFTSAQAHIRALEAGAPWWYQPAQIAGSVWIYSEFLVLLTNRKRRALHDFMAGTVVIRTVTGVSR